MVEVENILTLPEPNLNYSIQSTAYSPHQLHYHSSTVTVSLICVIFVKDCSYKGHFSFRKNQLPASLQESFPCKINTFRKRVKNVVTSRGIGVGIKCK
jgi:G:T-mismatch repair DNA endonuclease (very short patch repair protein)